MILIFLVINQRQAISSCPSTSSTMYFIPRSHLHHESRNWSLSLSVSNISFFLSPFIFTHFIALQRDARIWYKGTFYAFCASRWTRTERRVTRTVTYGLAWWSDNINREAKLGIASRRGRDRELSFLRTR